MDNLEKILEEHKKWLSGDGGIRAYLSGAYLSGAYLRGADLTEADLTEADLRGADLRGADLSGAYLSGAYLRGADLTRADLTRADLSGAYLSGAYLRGADLTRADLRGADLSGADLSGAYLRGANLRGVRYDENTAFFALQCPEEGSFIGYKICKEYKIVKLLITEDAKRSSATTRKCRASKAKVLEITNIENTEKYETAVSKHDANFIYKVGETIEIENFDEDRWSECSEGIHFFITREEAIQYD